MLSFFLTKKASKKSLKSAHYPRVAEDTFVTQKMLYKVRDELKEHSSSLFHGVKSEMHGLKSEVHDIKKSVHRIELLVEEQNNRNKIVLDGLSQLFSRQDHLENNFAEFKR